MIFGLILASFAFCPDDEVAIISGQDWEKALQHVGANHDRGRTTAQSNLARKKLVAEIGGLEPATVRMESTVKEVRWKDGVAEVYTEQFLPKPNPDVARPPLRIVRIFPFELKMDEESAAEIEPGAKIEFVGRMVFNAGQWGAVGRELKQQQLHSVNHVALGGLPLGTYTSPNAKVSIAGKLYPNRWAP